MASNSEPFTSIEELEINGKAITKLKVEELKEELLARGLEKAGLKKELLERLGKAITEEKKKAASGPLEERKGMNNDETCSQEVSSTTTETVGMPSVAKMNDSNGEHVSKTTDEMVDAPNDKKDSLKNTKENKDEEKTNEPDTTENNEPEDVEDGEITGQDEEKTDIQKAAVPEKRRRISLTRQKSDNPPTPGSRKRKWASKKPKSSVVISTDSLKDLIPGVQLASTPALEAVMELDDDKDDEEVEVTLVKSGKPQEPDEKENQNISKNKLDEKSPHKKRIVQLADSKTVTLGEIDNQSEVDDDVIIIEKPKAVEELPPDSNTADAGEHEERQSVATPPTPEPPPPVEREVSPARNPPSCAVHVFNLVRPFTQKQLVQHLSQFGAVAEGGFWMNKIKSHCYVIYATVEEATNARQSMHGQRWPATSPKTLRADFANNDKMIEDTGGQLGKKLEKTVEPEAEQKNENVVESKERSKSKEKSSRKHKEKKNEKKKDEPTPANLLDKLFRKTTAPPCIYWLPLTNEQIAAREKDREERRKQRAIALQQEKQQAEKEKPRESPRKPLSDKEKPRETDRPRAHNIPREQDRRPLRDNRGSSPPVRQRPDRRPSPAKRRSRSPPVRRPSPPLRRPANRRR